MYLFLQDGLRKLSLRRQTAWSFPLGQIKSVNRLFLIKALNNTQVKIRYPLISVKNPLIFNTK